MSAVWIWLKKWFWAVLAGLSFLAGLLLPLFLRRSPSPPQAPPTTDPYDQLKDSIAAREEADRQKEAVDRAAEEETRKNREALESRIMAAREAHRAEAEAIRRRYEQADPEQIRAELLSPLPPKKEGGWVRVAILGSLILVALAILLALSCLDSRSAMPEASASTTSRPVCLSRQEAASLQIERLRLQEAARECRERIGAIREEERLVCRAALQRAAIELRLCRDERTRALSRPPCPPARACSCVWPVVGGVAVGILVGGGVGVAVGWAVR